MLSRSPPSSQLIVVSIAVTNPSPPDDATSSTERCLICSVLPGNHDEPQMNIYSEVLDYFNGISSQRL